MLDVFESSAERQGSYDFLENSAISAEALCDSIGEASLMRANGAEVFVAVDGTSLTLTDRLQRKDFGAVGTKQVKARGLKVINAYAIAANGTPLGITAQVWWSRKPLEKRQNHPSRRLEQKETQHWITAITRTCALAERLEQNRRLCFVIDREGDAAHTLSAIAASGEHFIVRSAHDRRIASPGRIAYLRAVVARTPASGEYRLAVADGPGRRARDARMVVRFRRVRLRMRDRATEREWSLELTAVSARETGTAPRGENPLHWMLLTNRAVDTFEDACAVVRGYTFRWKIEEFHRTWKSGDCDIEQTQLRRMAHVIKWATLMATTAARVERMKNLSRNEPDQPASLQLSKYEIQALVFYRKKTKKRTDPEPTLTPTIGEAVRWIADIGGYTGPKSSGGLPGSVVIRRAFERILIVAMTMEGLDREGKLR